MKCSNPACNETHDLVHATLNLAQAQKIGLDKAKTWLICKSCRSTALRREQSVV